MVNLPGALPAAAIGLFFLAVALRFTHGFCSCSTKLSAKGKAPGKAGTRFWKNVGLGFKTPREAIEVCGYFSKIFLFTVLT